MISQNNPILIIFPEQSSIFYLSTMSKIKTALSASILFVALFILSCSSNSDDYDFQNSFKDLRDGQMYRWVKIGSQTWMAENLYYNAPGSKCYDNSSKECRKYGRLYDWKTAVDACPDGWHLPSDEEWQELIDFAGGDDIAGKKLRAKNGWGSNNGTDDYDFSALPGGFGYSSNNVLFFLQSGKYSNWWSVTEFNGYSAFERNMYYDKDNVVRKDSDKNYLQSIRCVKNDSSYDSLYIGDLNSDSGTFMDSRNEQVYKWVEIGSQTWMAENLNYDAEGSLCYNNDPANCEKYGRLYDWVTARTVCPDGWHLPSNEEWGILTEEVGGKSIAGVKLKFTDGWNHYPVHKGTDNYNFSAVPSGFFNSFFRDIGYGSYWWSTTEEKDYYDYYDKAYYLSMHHNSSNATSFYDYKSSLNSVRCVKGSANDFSGSFSDSRDGQTYQYVKIGSQIWMAENLNYDVESSVCYDNKSENCEKYGKLYDWETALNVCPKDWHLPSHEEWITLTIALGGPAIAGAKLKTKNGWNDSGNGTDDYGFSALSSGHGDSEGNFLNVGEAGDWWSADEHDDNTFAIERHIEFVDDKIVAGYTYKSLLLSVRCIKD